MKLGVNVDHIATLRQARGGKMPDPVAAAKLCERMGVHSIVMHLREDRRHIKDPDVFRAKRALAIKFNLEMSIAPSIVGVAARLKPDQVTLVPEKRQEKTTEGGLDLFKRSAELRRVLRLFKKKKISVSLFIDPDARQIREAKRLGVEAIELHTGDYANARTAAVRTKELRRLKAATELSRGLGLATHAGHGLDYENVKAVTKIKGLEELNIGYSIITRSVWVGLEKAVREMLRIIK